MLRRVLSLMVLVCSLSPVLAQDDPKKTPEKPVAISDEQRELFEAFTKSMTNVKLSGNFTIDGAESGKLIKDEYVISSVKKLEKGDSWLINAQIKYGAIDVTLPVPVEVKWAGKTPVITLDDITIPGLGTFSSRVLFDRGKYAGTWTHDKVGGTMFGNVLPVDAKTEKSEASSKEPSPKKEPQE